MERFMGFPPPKLGGPGGPAQSELDWHSRVQAALLLINSVPGHAGTVRTLRRARLRFHPELQDRAQVNWTNTLTLGPEVFAENGDAGLVSLTGTLVHEAYHLMQFPLLKTVSFWAGVATRSHVMARYERPAYRSQAQFLNSLARTRPDLAELAHAERAAALAAFAQNYE